MAPIAVNKKYGYTASIISGSNSVIACSKADWSAVRDGSFIIMTGDANFYKVVSKKRFIYEKTANVLNSTQLKVNESVGAMISSDDDISFAFKDYTVTAVSISSGGEGYQVGDILRPDSGTHKYNSIDQIDTPAQVKVLEVSGAGEILSVELLSGGLYSEAPDSECGSVSDLGSGALLNVTSEASDTSSIEDRTVVSVEFKDNYTILHLNHPLPPRLNEGNIKVEKWNLTLDKEYVGQSKYSAAYEIIKDFTPHCNLPLMQGGFNHIMFNEAMALIDQKLKDLENGS